MPLLLGLLSVAPPPAHAADGDAGAGDADVLLTAALPADGPGLIDFLRRRALPEADRARVRQLIGRLGDDDFDVREKAMADLRAVGPAALPFLREALRSPDPEVVVRAQRCLGSIEQSNKPGVLAAAVRTLGRLRPAGAAEALLAAAPSLDEAEVLDEACRALAAVAVRAGRVDPAVARAAADPSPVKRGMAGAALALAGGADGRPAAARLLQDPDASVRQRVALALAEVHDKQAVPTLVALLEEVPAEESGPVEETLRAIAGDHAPSESPGADADSRRRCRAAWEGWWKQNGAALDLAKTDLTTRRLGYTLVVETGARVNDSRVVEYDAAGKERWAIDGLRAAIDAQMVGPDRVLIAERIGGMVSERNLKNEPLWQYRASGVLLGARRLPGGDTFVVTRNQLVIVDKDGKETASIPRPNNDVCAAAKFRDGTIALLNVSGQVIRLDESGKELRTQALNTPVLSVGTNIEALPNGHVLIPLYSNNKVVEIDEDGKTVWEVASARPSSVARLANGHTLVTGRMSGAVVELDHDGKEVRTLPVQNRPVRAVPR